MIPSLTAKAIRAWDEYTIQHEPIASIDLMERAAQCCFHWIQDRWNNSQPFAVLCGRGNNGGDGLVIARQLLQAGYPVEVYLLPGNNRSPDNQKNLHRLVQFNQEVIMDLNENLVIPPNTILIDALLGTGLNEPLQGELKMIVEKVNAMHAYVISIDLPSGMNADDYKPNDSTIQATDTLTFQCYKLCMSEDKGFRKCGRITVLDIGLHPEFLKEGKSELLGT